MLVVVELVEIALDLLVDLVEVVMVSKMKVVKMEDKV
jgi:hypothetical protein|tara:strand:- start:84 stop:194 length:111 start_codon:yes stop_codon:yes gene_type:complete